MTKPTNLPLRRYTALPFAIDYLHTKELALPSPSSWDDRNDSYYVERFAELEKPAGTFALCLTEAPETYHHWRIFSAGTSGVCITFDRKRLDAAVRKVPGLRGRLVEYRRIDELEGNLLGRAELPFLKRYPFKDEREYRLFIAPMEPVEGLFRFTVPLAAVDRITLSPWLTKAVAQRVKTTLKRIPGCQRLKIYRSTLVENERWMQYGTKAV